VSDYVYESPYDSVHDLHTKGLGVWFSFGPQLQLHVNTYQEKLVKKQIACHLVQEIVQWIVHRFVRIIVCVDGSLQFWKSKLSLLLLLCSSLPCAQSIHSLHSSILSSHPRSRGPIGSSQMSCHSKSIGKEEEDATKLSYTSRCNLDTKWIRGWMTWRL
jgi:hypothetical protein